MFRPTRSAVASIAAAVAVILAAACDQPTAAPSATNPQFMVDPPGIGEWKLCKKGSAADFNVSVKVDTMPTATNSVVHLNDGQCTILAVDHRLRGRVDVSVKEQLGLNMQLDSIAKDSTNVTLGGVHIFSTITGTDSVFAQLRDGDNAFVYTFYNKVLTPSLQISKTADAALVDAGNPIGFTVTVTNNGTGTATNVQVSDPLPIGGGLSWSESPDNADCSIAANSLNCSFGDLAPGATRTVHITSPTTSASCGVVNNTATYTSDNAGTNNASASTTVQCASVVISKTADAASVNAGSNIGFTVTVTNNGPGAAAGVTLADPLPTGTGISWSESPDNANCAIAANMLSCNFGTLAAGASASVHVTSPTVFASCGTYNNTATFNSDNGGTGSASASTAVQCPSLAILKTADAASVTAGSNIGFTVTVNSNGPGTATSVTLTDALPTGAGISWSISPAAAGCSISSNTLSCSFGDLASGASRSVHVVSPTTNSSCAAYPNTASASATNHATVQSSATTTVTGCIVFGGDETATGAGFPWSATQGAPANWFMYSPWVTTSGFRGISTAASGSTPAGIDLIAGQTNIAGRITGTRGTTTSITITLNSSYRFSAVTDNVKILPMSCTAAQPYVQPGKFTFKTTVSQASNTVTVTGLPNTACYGIHATVQQKL